MHDEKTTCDWRVMPSTLFYSLRNVQERLLAQSLKRKIDILISIVYSCPRFSRDGGPKLFFREPLLEVN